MSRITLLFILAIECVLSAADHQQEISLSEHGIVVCSQEEAKKRIIRAIEDDLPGFSFLSEDDEDTVLEKSYALPFLEKMIINKGHSFCRNFSCPPDVRCEGVAPRTVNEPILPDSVHKTTIAYQLTWAFENNNVAIKSLVCTSAADDARDWELVENHHPFDDDFPQQSSWLPQWWSGARSAPASEPDPVIAEQAHKEQQGSYLSKVWGFTVAAASTFIPAVQTFVESKKDADLLDPKTWHLTGQLYELGKIWFVQAAAMGVEALETKDEVAIVQQPAIYLDDILLKVAPLLSDNGQNLTPNQIEALRRITEEATLELSKFKMKRAAEMNSMLSQVTAALPIEETVEKPTQQNPPGVPAAPPISVYLQKFQPKQPRLTIRDATASTQKVKAAARPTLLDLKDEPILRLKFEFLRQILEFPFIKWGVQKEDLLQRHEIVPKRGSAEYEQKLWAFAQNVAEESNAKDSKRTLKYFYAEPGNGKTSGIEEMLVGWLELPLCKINYQEIHERNTQEFPNITEYIKSRIINCMRVNFTEKSTGMKIRNGIVLLDDFDRILNTVLAEHKNSKDRENFFLLLKDLSDPSQKELNAKLTVKLQESSVHSMDFPVRISDLYFFITANSVPPEFDEKTSKSEMINTVLSRVEVYQVPYADREQRMQMLLSLWQPVEDEMNKQANGKFVINHELCVEALKAIIKKDGKALDKMNGNMGVRGLIELFFRFKGTMLTRKPHENICQLDGKGINELPFIVKNEAKSIGEYKKEQTENLRLNSFIKELEQFLKESEDDINDLCSKSEFAREELNNLKNKNKELEQREEALQKIRELIAKNNPTQVKEIDDNEKQRIIDAITENLSYLGEQNLNNILEIANTTLKNIVFGGNENVNNSIVFLKQESTTDLGIIAKVAEILDLPYCKIDDSLETIAIKTPIIWKEHQKEKQPGNVYLRLNSGSSLAATWDEAKRIYVSINSSNGKSYIAGKPYDPNNPVNNFYAVETTEYELNRLTLTDSPWIDVCAQQLKKHQLKNLDQVLVLIDRTKQKIGFDTRLMTALMESTDGMTRRASGSKMDMRKATIVVSAKSSTITPEDLAQIEQHTNRGKMVAIDLYPLAPKDRIHFAESYLERQLLTIAQELKLSAAPELNKIEKVALHFITYLDLTAYWQVQEKDGLTIIIDPLRDMITTLSNRIKARKTAFLTIKTNLNDYTNLFREFIDKWRLYYEKNLNYPIEVPSFYADQPNESFGSDDWKESVISWTEQDMAIYHEEIRQAELERLQREEEQRLAEEARRQQEKELAQTMQEEKRRADEAAEEKRKAQRLEQAKRETHSGGFPKFNPYNHGF